MFSVALPDHVAPWLDSPWFDLHTLAANLIEGVIATFVGLAILFSVKPRLTITPSWLNENRASARGEILARADGRSDKYAFRVSNKSLSKAIEVKVQVLKVRRLGSRKKIDLVVDELFELRGRWSRLDPPLGELLRARSKWLSSNRQGRPGAREEVNRILAERKRDKYVRAHFTFYPCLDHEAEMIDLGKNDYIVFQVIAKNSLTNFSRLHKRRFTREDLNELAEQRMKVRADVRDRVSGSAATPPPGQPR